MNDECREKGREKAREGKTDQHFISDDNIRNEKFFTKRWDYPRLTNRCVFIF